MHFSLRVPTAGAGQQAHGPAPAPQVALPPALLLPDQGDDEMMANAKRIAAEVRSTALTVTLQSVRASG